MDIATAQALLQTGPYLPLSELSKANHEPVLRDLVDIDDFDEMVDNQVQALELVLNVARRQLPVELLVARLEKLEDANSPSEAHEMAERILQREIAEYNAYLNDAKKGVLVLN